MLNIHYVQGEEAMQGTLMIDDMRYENVILVSLGSTDGICIYNPEEPEPEQSTLILKEVKCTITGTELELQGYREEEGERNEIMVRFKPYGERKENTNHDWMLTEEEKEELKDILDEVNYFNEENMKILQVAETRPSATRNEELRYHLEVNYQFTFLN
jgi:hypothetical protein